MGLEDHYQKMNRALFIQILRVPFIRKYTASKYNNGQNIASIQCARKENTSANSGRITIILEKLKAYLGCSERDATDIYDDYPSVRLLDHIPKVRENIAILQSYGVTADSIINSAFVLIMEKETLKCRIGQVNKMQMQDINDLVPLLQMTEDELCRFGEQSAKDKTNRIYHFSDKFMIAPNIVAKHFARHCDVVCFGQLARLDQTAQLLLDYNIEPKTILEGIYAFFRSDEHLLNRLEQLKAHKCAIHIRHLCCSDEEFQKVLDKEITLFGDISRIESNNPTKLHIESIIMRKIGCEYEEAAKIYHTVIPPGVSTDLVESNIEHLKQFGLNNDAIKANFELTLMPPDVLCYKLDKLSSISAFHINDLLPLASVNDTVLNHFIMNVMNEHSTFQYFSKTLNVSLMNVFKYFATCPDLLIRPNDLQIKLDILLTHQHFDKDSILSTAHIFLYSPEHMKIRLDELSEISTDKIKAYMLKNQMTQLLSAFEKKKAENMALAEFSGSTLKYLSTRFGWTDKQVESAVETNPFLLKLTFTKAKKFTDLILNETDFTGADILKCIRVLRHSPEETRSRYIELSSIGLRPISLGTLVLDKKRYVQFLRKYCEKKNSNWDQFWVIEKRVKENKYE